MAKPRHVGPHETSQRMLRVGEVVRHIVAEALARGSFNDPVLDGHVITVPEVRMTPDLKLATIYVMPLGGKDMKPVLAALERQKKPLRATIAHKANLRFAPDVRFRADESFDKGARIDALLASPEVRRDLAVLGSEDEPDGPPDAE
jgi:ribosome-binding factor A